MYPNNILCAPIYVNDKHIRHAALEFLEDLEALEGSKLRQWVDVSTIFLDKDGSFLFKIIDEGSFRVHMRKASLFIMNLFSSPKLKALEEEQQRLHYARRGLLVSLLAHAWLWRKRLKVLDNDGNPVAFKDRRVLAPEDIFQFLSDTRVHTSNCRCENIQDFLEKIQDVSLYEDKSKWNMMGVIACLRWDKLHNLHKEGPWCSCRLEEGLLPPSYNKDYLTKN